MVHITLYYRLVNKWCYTISIDHLPSKISETKNDKIQFSDYTDNTEIITENLQIKMELNYLEFTSQLRAKINEMESFKQKLKQVIIGSELEEKEIIIKKIL